MKTIVLPVKILRLLALASTFFLLFWLISSIGASSIHADDCTAISTSAESAINNINKCAISKDVFDDKVFNLNQLSGTIDSSFALLFGQSGLHPQLNAALSNQSALAFSGSLVASLYASPPASGIHYMAGLIDKVNPVKSAYAQTTGIGYDTLQPIQNIWTAFRNISYVGFVIVFVITGFMIMFRAHISPQAVATVQDSIPRIVIALFLVTFSYAIAGFMIDLMFLFINIAINIMPNIDHGTAQNIFSQSIFQIITGSWTSVFAKVAGALSDMIKNTVDIGGFLGQIGLDTLFHNLGGLIGGLVVGIALLYVMFRVFLMLLQAYIMIIVLTLGAPFFFLIQALPGNNSAKSWFQQMASQVSVFLTVAVMLLLAAALGGLKNLGGSGPSLLSGEVQKFPLISGGFSAESIGGLIAVGFILMTPEAANLVRNAFGVKGQAGFGGAGAAALGAGLGAVQMGAGRAGRGLYERTIGPTIQAGSARRQQEAQVKGWSLLSQKAADNPNLGKAMEEYRAGHPRGKP